MQIYMCGYNSFSQLNFAKIEISENKVDKLNQNVRISKNQELQKQSILNPVIVFSFPNKKDIKSFKVFFTWSKCVSCLELSDEKCFTIISGFDEICGKVHIDVLEDLLCEAVLEEGMILRDKNNLLKIRGSKNGMMKPFSISLRSEENNEASSVDIQHTTAGHRDFYTVYNGVNLGKFSLSSASLENSICQTSFDASDTRIIQIKHIDFVTPVKQVSCGKEHVLLLSQSGNIYSYGLSSRGQLGHGEVEKETSPRLIDALDGLPMAAISAGGWHSAAVSEIGDLYVWGWNETGQLGLLSPKIGKMNCSNTEMNEANGSNTMTEDTGLSAVPVCVDIPGDENVKDVACGSRHTVVLSENGQVFTCGWNKYGQLGLGDTSNRNKLIKIEGFSACRIFAGHWNSAFVCE